MKHTEGPWEIHEATHRDGEFWCSIGYAGRGPISDIVGAEGNHTRFFQVVAGMKYLITPVEQQRANAYLIAAAPELLGALKNIEEWAEMRAREHACAGIHCSTCSPMEIVEEARAAIARAEGTGKVR